MSLMEQVIAEVEEMGSATVDDLLPAFPGVERTQLRNALSWARYSNRLRVIERGARRGKGSLPSLYASAVVKFSPDEAGWTRPVSFVFDLGLAAQGATAP